MSIHDPCTCFTFQDVSDPSCPIHGGYHQVRELRPPEQVLINPPKVPGTVEDSHAKLAAEMRNTTARWLCNEPYEALQVVPGTAVDAWAARVEQLGREADARLGYATGKWETEAEESRAREAEIATVVAKLRSIAKQMNDAPFDYAELIGDWNEGIRLACQELEAARLGGATA